MIQGTIKTLSGKLKFGDETLNETKLRALFTLGEGSFVKVLGHTPSNGKRGRPEKVYQINESARAKVSVEGKAPAPVEYVAIG